MYFHGLRRFLRHFYAKSPTAVNFSCLNNAPVLKSSCFQGTPSQHKSWERGVLRSIHPAAVIHSSGAGRKFENFATCYDIHVTNDYFILTALISSIISKIIWASPRNAISVTEIALFCFRTKINKFKSLRSNLGCQFAWRLQYCNGGGAARQHSFPKRFAV